MLPDTMTAIAIRAPGGPEMLVPEQRPLPRPGDNEILIRVHAAGVNRPDIIQRAGGYPPPPGASDIPGLEIAGEVVANGPDSHDLKVGDRVMASVGLGGFADEIVLRADQLTRIPDRLSFGQAATMGQSYCTAWFTLTRRVPIQEGETVLVLGAGGGVGGTPPAA